MKQYIAFINAQLVLYPLEMWVQGDFIAGRRVEGYKSRRVGEWKKNRTSNIQSAAGGPMAEIKEIWFNSNKVGRKSFKNSPLCGLEFIAFKQPV